MTLDQLIAQVRDQINAKITARNAISTELGEARGSENPDQARVDELRGQQAAIDAEITTLTARKASLEAELVQDQAIARLAADVAPVERAGGAAGGKGDDVARVGDVQVNEKRTYNADADKTGERFIRDVAGAFLGSFPAQERLGRHMAEERAERGDKIARAIDTSAVPGLVVPQYLIDLYAPRATAGRPFADICRHHDLPAQGMTVYIPRQTDSTTVVDEQVNELDPVLEGDIANDLVPVPVRTVAGMTTLSRQALERAPGTLDITMDDLLKTYNQAVDRKLLQHPTDGLTAVATPVTYTDADPTAEELYRKLLAAAAGMEEILLDVDPGDVYTVMRGTRWHWFSAQLTDKWPFINQPGQAGNGVGTSNGARTGVRGTLPNGQKVIADNNIAKTLGTGTNQDELYVVAQDELHLWEDPNAPLFIRAEQPKANRLGVDLVLYGYLAWFFDRFEGAHHKVTGTGLVTPVF